MHRTSILGGRTMSSCMTHEEVGNVFHGFQVSLLTGRVICYAGNAENFVQTT